MTTISLKLPEVLLREIEREAAARGVGKSALIRDCLERALRKGEAPKNRVSCLDLMGARVGSFHGPPDLSTNKKYLKKALRADYERQQRKNHR